MPVEGDTSELVRSLRAFGAGYPGSHGKAPWPGHDDLAVRNKTFAYLNADGAPFSVSFKLPYTGSDALQLPGAAPTGYGLGKSGWVTLSAPPHGPAALDQLKAWLDESYRAQAPRALVKELDATG